MDASAWVTAAIAGTATLVAAFVGAWFAFLLEAGDRKRRSLRDHVAAVNRAQFVLIRQYNTLIQIQKVSVDPIRNHPGRHIAMRPELEIPTGPGAFDLDSLLFLLEGDDREWPFKLMVEQQRFETVVQAINIRSRLHFEMAQPALVAAGIQEGMEYAPEDFRSALGVNLDSSLRRLTDDVIKQVDSTVESSLELIDQFRTAMKRRFPKERIIYVLPADLLDPELKR